jgi:citrate lyase subunit beta / citryl-CoA lyase
MATELPTMKWTPPGPALLFCPADRPERFAKAAATADMVILDLEDGVAESDKQSARHCLEPSELDPSRTIVRVNPYGTEDQERDLTALARTSYYIVMLSKTESVEQVLALSPLRVVALCETPLGILAAAAIAAGPSTVGVMWGAEDLVAALGGRSSRQPDGGYIDVARSARSQVLLAAGASGVASIDAVHLDIGDPEGLRAEATDAVASGFDATACIHPSQVAVIRAAYRPTDEEVAWATRVLDASKGARGVFSYQGRMVDAPILRHAEHIVERNHPSLNEG